MYMVQYSVGQLDDWAPLRNIAYERHFLKNPLSMSYAKGNT